MARQFKRIYELTITTPNENRVITGLRVAFEITKSVLSFPNLARLEIFNANQTTISALQEQGAKISFNAGYEGAVELLFQGDVRNVLQRKSGVDRITTVFAGDGERDFQNAAFNKTFTSSVSISQAIQEVLKTFEEVSIGVVNGLPQVADKLRGQTLSGSSKDILDQFAKEYGFNWSIQNGEVVIVPQDEPLEGDDAVLINAATGMIGSPTLTRFGATISSYGVEVTTLLNPKLLPNRAIKIESLNAEVNIGNLYFQNIKKTTAEGFYKIQEVTFTGDTHDATWLAMVKGMSLNG